MINYYYYNNNNYYYYYYHYYIIICLIPSRSFDNNSANELLTDSLPITRFLDMEEEPENKDIEELVEVVLVIEDADVDNNITDRSPTLST